MRKVINKIRGAGLCADCLFFGALAGGNTTHCFKNAAVILGNSSQGVWPEVSESDACFEFLPKFIDEPDEGLTVKSEALHHAVQKVFPVTIGAGERWKITAPDLLAALQEHHLLSDADKKELPASAAWIGSNMSNLSKVFPELYERKRETLCNRWYITQSPAAE